MSSEYKSNSIEAWEKSRSGAWAARGFHYQHWISTLILIRQWAGLFPSGYLVPEGQEDCVVEFSGSEFWIQMKSRKEGKFGKTEIQKILNSLEGKAGSSGDKNKTEISVVLEQPCVVHESTSIDELFREENNKIFVCDSPRNKCISILTSQLDIAEVTAEGIVSHLYELVASISQENASLSFKNRKKISTTQVEHLIYERLEAEDPSSINHAQVSGVIEPIDFSTPITEPTFYQGVVEQPLCVFPYQALSGEESSQASEAGAIKILLLQAECVGELGGNKLDA